MTSSRLEMNAPAKVYVRRRRLFAENLERPVVIFAGHAPSRTYPANTFPFRAGSTYLYFGGPPIEGAAWLIEPGSDGDSGCYLLRPGFGPDDAVWFATPPSDETIAEASGISVSAIRDSDRLAAVLDGRSGGYMMPQSAQLVGHPEKMGLKPADDSELLAIINLRLIKDEHELKAMRRAASVAMEAHRTMVNRARPGCTDYEAAAAFEAVLTAAGCRHPYSPIITVHGEVLHGMPVGDTLRAGQLLLVDAAAEEPGGYACDITRTYPVSGEWSGLQRHIYDTVLAALNTAIDACVPGKRYREIHELAGRVVCAGLVEAALLKGDPEDLARRGAHTLFFTHGLGHLIGLDAHDMEDFGDLAGYAAGRSRPTRFGDRYLRFDRDLKPGMTFTIEPGIYFVPAVWKRRELLDPLKDALNMTAIEEIVQSGFGGIRLEHVVLVRPKDAGAAEVLTRDLPVDADAVAALMGK